MRLSLVFSTRKFPVLAAFLTLFIAAATLFALPPSHALTAEQQAVLTPFETMCDGLAKRDAKLIEDQLLPGGMATLTSEGKPMQMHFDLFAAKMQQAFDTYRGPLKETLYDPVIHIDHDVAVIWAPYVFSVDGKMEHCGTNIVTLVHQSNHWLVSNMADNRRTMDCPGK